MRPHGRSHRAGLSAWNCQTTRQTVFEQTPLLLAATEVPVEDPADTPDKLKAREITGFRDDDRTTRKFLELVVFPLGVCFALIMLLRRGFLK